MSKTVIFFNHKGGTGKTSLAAHLCFLAAERGISTMALSLDDQADIIRWVTGGQAVQVGRLYEISHVATSKSTLPVRRIACALNKSQRPQ